MHMESATKNAGGEVRTSARQCCMSEVAQPSTGARAGERPTEVSPTDTRDVLMVANGNRGSDSLSRAP
jgi:hypothetical protein